MPMIACSEKNHQLDLINQLNDYFNFDQNIFLFDSSTEMDLFINTTRQSSSFTPQSIHTIDSDNITGLTSLEGISSKNTFLIIVRR